KYFAFMGEGSDVLTSYLLAISHEAGWVIPEDTKQKMLLGLQKFVEGKIFRGTRLPTADLTIRKIAGIEALSRYGMASPVLLGSLSIDPILFPTSAMIDWFNIVKRLKDLPRHEVLLANAEQTLRSRLNFQGTRMGFSTEGSDDLWWLMVSGDVNATRFLLSIIDSQGWREDAPRILKGTLDRQLFGHWDLTLANAWGTLAVDKFSKAFEQEKITGETDLKLDNSQKTFDWGTSPEGTQFSFPWPSETTPSQLNIKHEGGGAPWATVQSLAAIPLTAPLSTGYKIKKTLLPVEQKKRGKWSRGDVIRVKLELEAQAERTWVVVQDPIPAGATILGSGLGRDSSLAQASEQPTEGAWLAFVERGFDSFRAYFDYVPKGAWTTEYTIRLNQAGEMHLPPTRVEAMYSPEMFGENPNDTITILEE
ncbi:MAG TPA: alpha-2-macroglobulin, partial [Bdellovibrionota bacterium]|nr:alpha-2-macroglobulin [Bdellovibrionota bacterium]